MKIVSWNVNGIRAILKKGFLDFVKTENPEILCLQEIKANKEQVGSFKDHGIGKLFGAHQYLPVVVAGSGPSLAGNGEQLKERGGIPLVSCLHNFHFFR